MSKPILSTRLALDVLDERLVPSAVMIDLTHRGDHSDAGAGLVAQTDAQPTGTGYIRSFLRIQGASSGGGGEQGYNTDARPLQFDENKSPQFTRSLGADLVPKVTVDGGVYREFLLDINQKSSSSKLSVDEVRLFIGGAPNLTATSAEASSGVHTLAGLSPVFDLDDGTDRTILLDARLNSGSGSGDMKLLVPDSAFGGAGAGSYVYMYSRMGATAGATANSGFEEWAVAAVPPTVPPPPPTGSLSGFAYFDQNGNNRYDQDEGIQGVNIELRYTDANGVTVSLGSKNTLSDGSYSFTGLAAGTYTIVETQPEGYEDGNDQVGSIGGSLSEQKITGNDYFYGILLNDGDQGTGYNFGERLG